MSKELEHLKIIEDLANEHHDSKEVWEHSIPIQQALQRLEQIDNSNPSEALKCLEKTISPLLEPILAKYEDDLSDRITANYFALKQALIKAQEQEKVLSIIKEKPYESAPTINYIKINKDNPKMLNYEHYCMTVKDKVNESEFVLLCEVNKYE